MYSSYSKALICLTTNELGKLQTQTFAAAVCPLQPHPFFKMFLRQELHILVSLGPCMFTVIGLALEMGGAANETPSFLIVFLAKPRLINVAKFPVCEQSTSDFRRGDDSQ